MERKLASIRRISDIQSIPGADAIEVAQVDGWNVVVKKREFNTGYLSVMKIQTFDDLLKFADGPGLFTDKREGLVFKSLVSDFTFKIISNNWLLANNE